MPCDIKALINHVVRLYRRCDLKFTKMFTVIQRAPLYITVKCNGSFVMIAS